ncbi:phage holin family protein [Actinomadura sp. NPDC047616]|uniref:phage holin family protein n=1 Tax=Actinomadura sp. NPDC047616 TaxID=3155914 RepID=UPI0033F0097B
MSEQLTERRVGDVTGRHVEDLAGASTAELIRHLSEQSARLVREELRLAQLELRHKGGRAAKAARMFGGAGAFALYGGGALVAAAVLALALVLPAWAAALIIGGVLFVVAGLMALQGRWHLRLATPPVRTADSVRADVHEIQQRTRGRR